MEFTKSVTIAFFSELQELLALGVTLQKALWLIEKSASQNKKCKELAKKIFVKVSQGYEFFSAASMYCNKKLVAQYAPLFNTDFDCSFLQKTLLFVCKQYEQNQAQKQKLLTESIYPLFLFLLSLGLSAFLYTSKDLFAFVKTEFNTKSMIFSILYLVAFTFSFFWIFVFVQKNTFEYNFFHSVNFLLSNNLEFNEALNICMLNFYSTKRLFYSDKVQTFFYDVKTSLLQGNSFYSSVKNSKLFTKETFNFLELNEWGSPLKNCISLVVNNLEKQKQTRISTFAKISEPTLILGIGIYLFLLIKNVALPFFTISENSFF